MPTVERIAEVSKGTHLPYVVFEYNGVKLLTTKSKLRPLIDITYELTHDPEVKKLAEEMGIKLRGGHE